MLRPVKVLLQRELRAGMHGDAFHLKTVALVERPIGAPRPMHLLGFRRRSVAGGLEPIDHELHVLIPVLGGDKHRIRGRDHDEVLDTERRDERSLGADVAVVRVDALGGTEGDGAIRVLAGMSEPLRDRSGPAFTPLVSAPS
jgi:hypothetical protein